MKDDYIYDYNHQNTTSSQIILPNVNKTYIKANEKSTNLICTFDCSECNEYRQCFECSKSSLYHLGVKENDKNPITCNSTNPIKNPYYKKPNSDKSYYFKCLELCKKCVNSF